MKNTNLFTATRKASRILCVALATSLLFASCKKDSTNTADTAVSDDEVAEAVTQAVSGTSGGMVTQSESTARMTSTSTLACGASSDTTIIGASSTGAVINYNYNLHFTRIMTCTASLPSQLAFTFNGASNYTAIRMSSADNSNAQITVTGLLPTSSSYILNENYVRNGTQQSKVRLQRSFASTITIVSSNITIGKATQKIVSGTATVQFSGSVSGGTTVTRGGTLTFLGGQQATLTLNGGGSYTIAW